LGEKKMKRKYVVENGKIVRTNPFCPRYGKGIFMADKGDWWVCGKCGDRYHKRALGSACLSVKDRPEK